MPTMNNIFIHPKTKQGLLLTGIMFFSITVVTIFFGIILKTPPFSIIQTFARQGYVLHHNLVPPCLAFKLNFNTYIYVILFFSINLSFIFQKFITKNIGITFQQFVFSIVSVLFFLVSLNQLYNFKYYYKFENELFGNKSIEEKNANLYDGIAYQYSRFCHANIQGHRNAQLITDADLSREPGMLAHRMLAYYLYPIDIREVRKKEPDYLLFFMKKNAKEHIPHNFEVIATLNKDNLVARRK